MSIAAARPERSLGSGPRSGSLRLAIVASHPVQYLAPWYRALAVRLNLQVLFAHRISPADHARGGFDVGFEWDTPLFEGYSFEWLVNTASRPGVDHFWGCNTPGIGTAIRRGDFDAVLVNGWQLFSYWQAIRAARGAGIPVLVRGDSQLDPSSSPIRSLLKRLAYPHMLRSFDVCLAVGRRNADYYRHYGVPDARIHRSVHCVDNDFFAHAAAETRRRRHEVRRELGLPVDAVVFMFAGKLTEKKRPLDLLEALRRVHQKHADVWGLIVGDGPLKAALGDYRRRHEIPCVMAGFQNQRRIAATYAAADALVLPSTSGETWGLVVNEAMACGLPVIVSDQVGCAADLVLDDETGFTYPCGDVAALAERVGALAGDRRRRDRMSAGASAHIVAYSPEAAADGVLHAIEHLPRGSHVHQAVRGTSCRRC
jgi:glycosyltransferase involved in cell wall biosynthesis